MRSTSNTAHRTKLREKAPPTVAHGLPVSGGGPLRVVRCTRTARPAECPIFSGRPEAEEDFGLRCVPLPVRMPRICGSVEKMRENHSMKKMGQFGLIAGFAWGAVACGPSARMVAPSDLAGQSQVLEVADRSSATGVLANESFKLGSYEITEVDRDWNSSSSFGAGAYGAGKKTTGYTFQLKAGGTTWKGTCASLAKGKSVGSISFANSTDVTCECEADGEKVQLKIGGETEATSGTFEAAG